MAIVKCKECGAEISNKAKTCPQCGSPVKKKTSLMLWGVILFFVIIFVAAIGGGNKTQSGASTQPVAKEDPRQV